MPFNGMKYYPLSVTATSVRNRPSAKCVNMSYEVREIHALIVPSFFCEYICGRREKQRGKEKQDLSKRQRKDGLKHRYTARMLNGNSQGLSVLLNSSEIHRQIDLISATSNKHGKL